MTKLILFFNHTLTDEQREAAYRELGVDRIVSPPSALQQLWANIPPEAEALQPLFEPFFDWLAKEGRPGDSILIQGDFGACYLLVNEAIRQGLTPIYSTTRRQANEEHLPDGRVRLEHHFRHIGFRKYGT